MGFKAYPRSRYRPDVAIIGLSLAGAAVKQTVIMPEMTPRRSL